MEQDNQLLKDFSDTEKGAYLSAIASIATADRKATEDEVEFLEALTESADLSVEQEQAVIQAANNPSANLQAHLDVLKDSQLRFSLLTDIISFAKADGQYTSDEQNRVKEIASYLNIDQTQFNALNQFVNTAETAHKEGQDVSQPAFMESSGMGNIFKSTGISPNILKGALAFMAPILLSRMMGGGRRRTGMSGGGGLLGGLLGGLAGSAMGRSGGLGGGGMLGGNMGGGMFGGLGSLFSIFGGNRGYGGFGGASGGLGSLLGGLLGGGRRSGGIF